MRSPLGDTDQWLGGGRSSGAERALGVAAMYAQHSRVYRVVDDVLRALCEPPEAGGLGGRGRTLYALAKVRYVHAGEQPPVAAQLAELAISERTYCTQVPSCTGPWQSGWRSGCGRRLEGVGEWGGVKGGWWLERERPGGEGRALGASVVVPALYSHHFISNRGSEWFPYAQ